jgi:tyrosine-protein kinase Etk/Wzc
LTSTAAPPSLKPPSDTVDFAEIAALLRRRFWVIALFVLAGTILALAFVFHAAPQFTATGALYLGDAQSASGGTPDSSNLFNQNYSVESDIETQIELITSKAIVQKALLETGLNARIQPENATTLRFWRWRIRDHGNIDAYQPGPDTLRALYATVPGAYTVVLGKNGTYSLYLKAADRAGMPLLSGVLGQPASGGGIQLLIQPAGSNFQDVIGKRYQLTVVDPGVLAQNLLGGPITVNAGGSVTQPTKIAFLQFRWFDPYQAQALLNQIMQNFIATQLDWKTQSASTTQEFVASQLKQVDASLANADKNLAQYQAKTGIMQVSLNAQSTIGTMAQYQSQRSALLLQVFALQALNKDLKDANGPLNPYLASQANDSVLAGLTSALAASYVKLAALQTQFFDGAVEIESQQAQIDRQQSAIKTIAENDLATAQRDLAQLDQQIAGFQRQIESMPADSLKVISLQRSVDVLGQLYVLLMEKEQEAEVSKAETIVNTRIVTAAAPPNVATSPKAAISVVFGAFVGLVVGMALVFGQQAFSGRFESEEQVRKAVQLPVYAVVPKRPKPAMADFPRQQRGDPFFEAFHLLRSGLYRAQKIGESMIVLVIAAAEGDGSTTMASNLAKALADDGCRTALVGADLYSPQPDPIVAPGNGGYDTAPTENYMKFSLAELLAVGQSLAADRSAAPNEVVLKAVFAVLSNKFDFIILDSPPLPGVADGMTLGGFADIILSVISLSKTWRRGFAAHIELLSVLQRLHGVIINQAAEPVPYKTRRKTIKDMILRLSGGRLNRFTRG